MRSGTAPIDTTVRSRHLSPASQRSLSPLRLQLGVLILSSMRNTSPPDACPSSWSPTSLLSSERSYFRLRDERVHEIVAIFLAASDLLSGFQDRKSTRL